jgi:hypothetical protein
MCTFCIECWKHGSEPDGPKVASAATTIRGQEFVGIVFRNLKSLKALRADFGRDLEFARDCEGVFEIIQRQETTDVVDQFLR